MQSSSETPLVVDLINDLIADDEYVVMMLSHLGEGHDAELTEVVAEGGDKIRFSGIINGPIGEQEIDNWIETERVAGFRLEQINDAWLVLFG